MNLDGGLDNPYSSMLTMQFGGERGSNHVDWLLAALASGVWHPKRPAGQR